MFCALSGSRHYWQFPWQHT